MPIIRANTGIITQINVFTVPEGGQDGLIAYLREATRVASDVPGWLSASLHRSIDGTRVANYAQCEDRDAMGKVFHRLNAAGMIDGNKAYGEASPGLYEVVFTLER